LEQEQLLKKNVVLVTLGISPMVYCDVPGEHMGAPMSITIVKKATKIVVGMGWREWLQSMASEYLQM
jgi:hypothetical protein